MPDQYVIQLLTKELERKQMHLEVHRKHVATKEAELAAAHEQLSQLEEEVEALDDAIWYLGPQGRAEWDAQQHESATTIEEAADA